MRIARLVVRAVIVSATCLALGSPAGCHAISGATDYETSFAVGDWRSVAPLLGMNITMSLTGDGNGEAAIPYWVSDDQGRLQLIALGFSASWSAEDETTFDLHLVCVDVVCTESQPPAHLEGDARCKAHKDGAELACVGAEMGGSDGMTFVRAE